LTKLVELLCAILLTGSAAAKLTRLTKQEQSMAGKKQKPRGTSRTPNPNKK